MAQTEPVSYRAEVALQDYAHVRLDARAFLPASAGKTLDAQQGGGDGGGAGQHAVHRHRFCRGPTKRK